MIVASAARGLELGGRVGAGDAERIVGQWARMGVVRIAMHPLLERVLQLRHNLSAYDAMYVALAEELGRRLVTADARIAASPGIRCGVDVLPR
jgi:predicted nucleic acid-binding protein